MNFLDRTNLIILKIVPLVKYNDMVDAQTPMNTNLIILKIVLLVKYNGITVLSLNHGTVPCRHSHPYATLTLDYQGKHSVDKS
jgi:hypothetical protein